MAWHRISCILRSPMFITMLRTDQLSLSQINPVHALPSFPFTSTVISPSHVRLGLPIRRFPSGSPTKLNARSTYLLTPWCRVLEKLTGLQLVKKFPAFHVTWRFITALTSVRHLSLSWASPIQSIYSHPTSWRSILILFTYLRLGLSSGFLPFGFPTKTLYTPSPHPYTTHAQPISFFSILSPAQYWVRSYAISSIPPLPLPS